MNEYRIIEKKGEYKTVSKRVPIIPFSLPLGGMPIIDIIEEVVETTTYIPKYIVQKGIVPVCHGWDDLKEFTDLDEARKFKRDLELEDGIVIE